MDSAGIRRLLLFFTVFLIPFAGYRITTGVVSLSLTNLFIVVTVLYIFYLHSRTSDIRLSRLDLAVLTLLIGVLAFGSFSSFATGGSLRWLTTVTGWLLLFGVVSFGADSRHDLHLVIHAAFLSAITISTLVIVSSVFHIDFNPTTQSFYRSRAVLGFQIPFTRTVSIPLSHGEFGMFVTGIAPYSLLIGIKDRDLRYIIGTAIILFAVLFIVQGRSTWLALIVGMFSLFVLHPLRWWMSSRTDWAYRRLRQLGFAAAPVGFAGIAYVFVSIGGSLQARVNQVLTSLEVVAINPVFGIGYGPNIVEPIFGGFLPHNAFLRFGVSLGGVVLVLFVLTVLLLLISGYRLVANSQFRDHMLAAGVFAGFLAALVEANFLIGFGKTFWLWAGILAANYRVGQTDSVSMKE